jgi:hypothetical protein
VIPPMKRIHQNWYLGTADAQAGRCHHRDHSDAARAGLPLRNRRSGQQLSCHRIRGKTSTWTSGPLAF